MDIGENSYSMVLADDLTGNGKMDLLVTTMNGNVVCLGTDVDYHPLKAWPSREIGNNNVEMRDGRQGIFVLDQVFFFVMLLTLGVDPALGLDMCWVSI